MLGVIEDSQRMTTCCPTTKGTLHMVRDELLGCVGFGILSVIWSAITWKRVIGRAAMKRERRAKLDRVVESVTRAVKATNETKR